MKISDIKLLEFAEIFTFSSPAPVVSVLANIAHNATSSLIWRNVKPCMMSYSAKNLSLKIVYNKRKFLNMPFISSREAKKVYFIHGFATYEICILCFTR